MRPRAGCVDERRAADGEIAHRVRANETSSHRLRDVSVGRERRMERRLLFTLQSQEGGLPCH